MGGLQNDKEISYSKLQDLNANQESLLMKQESQRSQLMNKFEAIEMRITDMGNKLR